MTNERLNMKIVVIGGTGLIGSKVVTKLGDEGYEAVAASPNTGVNTLTGEGLAEVLEGASAVIDVSNSPSFADAAVMEFFKTSTGNLLTYEAAAGVGHHVALSIVGTDSLPDSGYMRAKVAQEKLIKESSIPYSIIRATQFFEFVNRIADSATDGNTVHLPPVGFQPMAADDVASAVARVATASPLNGIIEVAGPEQFRFDELIRLGLSARKDPREVIADPRARYFGTELSERSLVPGDDAQLGETHFEDWLSRSASQLQPANPQPTAVASASKGVGGPQK
ncbi:MAG: SDR family oxidoreductase [Pyrinomonadaceae bacterium]